MACKHLKEMYEICRTHNLKLSSTDLIRIVCPKCGVEEVCPSILVEQYESQHGCDGENSPPKGGNIPI